MTEAFFTVARRRAAGRDIRGILLLDKPGGLTSNRALQRVKRLFDARKAGHTGSLDPLATGMLPICFGAATRMSAFLLESGKSYAVTAELGVATDTGDADGRVTERQPVVPPTREEILQVCRSFLGTIEQIPPMYSALKRDGQRLYELARRGEVVERPPRTVHIGALEPGDCHGSELKFTVGCSKGTYVRSLVVDMGQALGTVAHVTALRRLWVEPFVEQPMFELDILEQTAADGGLAALDALLLGLDSAVVDWPSISLPPVATEALLHGCRVPAEAVWPRGQVRLYAATGEFLGLGEVLSDGILASKRLFCTI